jgi:predicted neuraminidase
VSAILGLAIILAYPALADDANERAAIAGIIASLNSQADSLSDLLAPGNVDIDPAFGTEEQWSEVTHSQLAVRSTRIVSPNIAIVDADNIQYGSLILKRSQPTLLLFRKYGSQWRIACILAEKSK